MELKKEMNSKDEVAKGIDPLEPFSLGDLDVTKPEDRTKIEQSMDMHTVASSLHDKYRALLERAVEMKGDVDWAEGIEAILGEKAASHEPFSTRLAQRWT